MYYDVDTEGYMTAAAQLQAEQASAWPLIRAAIMERCQVFEAGRIQAPSYFNRLLHEIDPLLQLRWNYEYGCWCVDRYVAVMRAWVPVVLWRYDGMAMNLDGALLEALREGDMWRFPNPAAWLAFKRERARKRRMEHEKASNENMLAVIDQMTTKRIKEFIEVERAFHTGETIIAAGQMEKTLDRMNEAGRKALAAGVTPPRDGPPINPGMHPSFHRRTKTLEQRMEESQCI